MIAVLTLSKKELDSEKAIFEQVTAIETKNFEAARTQLEWIGRDLTDPQSTYALHTVSIEELAYDKTREVVSYFDRVKKCRTAFARCRPAYETAKWASMIAILVSVLTIGALYLQLPDFVLHCMGVAVGLPVIASVVAFVVAERCTQVIQGHNARSRRLDATTRS
jgi:hypothetical protein